MKIFKFILILTIALMSFYAGERLSVTFYGEIISDLHKQNINLSERIVERNVGDDRVFEYRNQTYGLKNCEMIRIGLFEIRKEEYKY